MLFFGVFVVLILSFNGKAIAQLSDTETLDISAVVPGATPPGGGGGSSSGSTVSATIVMSGNTFPNAKLTLLKDGAVTTTLFANADGTFQITLNNLNFGNYQLSLFAEDTTGNTSSPHVLNVSAVTTQPYVYSGILLPPTLLISPNLIKVNSAFIAKGYSAPNSIVSLSIPGGKTLGTGIAGQDGYYEINALASLPSGLYSLRAVANLNGVVSKYSKPVQVLVYSGELPPGEIPLTPPAQLASCVDFNRDERVNLVDFSILLFWFNRNQPPANVDCNKDNYIDLKDFSILMYFWTG